MVFKVARSESLISGRVRVTFVSSSCIMPGTTIAIDCLSPMMARIVSAAAMDAGDGAAGAVAAGAAGAAGVAGGVVSAAFADTLKAANRKRARPPWAIPARAGIKGLLGMRLRFSVRVAKHFDPLVTGDDRRARKADEKPVFDDAGD